MLHPPMRMQRKRRKVVLVFAATAPSPSQKVHRTLADERREAERVTAEGVPRRWTSIIRARKNGNMNAQGPTPHPPPRTPPQPPPDPERRPPGQTRRRRYPYPDPSGRPSDSAQVRCVCYASAP